MEVLVFKTNVKHRIQVSRVKRLLTAMPAVSEWNFDLEDCDRILRIVSRNLSPRLAENTLQRAGIDCEELAY